MTDDARIQLEDLFRCGIRAVSGEHSVREHFTLNSLDPVDAILSIGKAGCAMYQGVPSSLREDAYTLIITKKGHVPSNLKHNGQIQILESAHPIPNEKSLQAGIAALDFVNKLPIRSTLLCLVSGGASALVEVLKNGYDLEMLAELTNKCIAQGDDIATINSKRSKLSLIKKGGLLSNFKGERVITLAISDVKGDDVAIIGSGVCTAFNPKFNFQSHIVASNERARLAIAREATINVIENQEMPYSDINVVAKHIFKTVSSGPKGLYIFGGEPTVKLPKNPGQGGRNQALGLLLAKHFSGNDQITCLVAGTDGTDGPTDAAGAYIDGTTYKKPDADVALENANSGAYFEKSGNLFITGPTGTNVMDIALILKN